MCVSVTGQVAIPVRSTHTCGIQSGTGTGFLPLRTSISTVTNITTALMHSFVCH